MVSSLRRAFDRPILAKKPWGHPDPNGIPQIHNAKFFPLNYPPDFTKKRILFNFPLSDAADHILKEQALGHLCDLLEMHWREAHDSAEEDGKFGISFKMAVTHGVTAKLKVTVRISTTIADEVESTVDGPNQPTLL